MEITLSLVSEGEMRGPRLLEDDEFAANLDRLRTETFNQSHPAQRQRTRQDVVQDTADGTESVECEASQQPSQFSFQCPYIDCEYTTITLYDPKQVEYLVKLLSMHTEAVHGQNADENGSETPEKETHKSDREGKELKAALSKRIVQKVMDDANLNLCEARFFAFPINRRILGQNMPIASTPVNTVVDLTYTGVDVTNPALLRKLHNRGTISYRLPDFSDTNLRGSHATGNELIATKFQSNQLKLGRAQKELESAQEALKAFLNFMILSRNFHPLDTSQAALFKVALEKFLDGPPKVAHYISLFEKFIHVSAGRAQMNNEPLTYKDVLDLWNTYIAPPAMNTISVENMVEKKVREALEKTPRKKVGSTNQGDSPAKKSRSALCPHWNVNINPPFCPNQQSNGGCVDSTDNFLYHKCSVKIGNKFCNSSKHNKHTH